VPEATAVAVISFFFETQPKMNAEYVESSESNANNSASRWASPLSHAYFHLPDLGL
jgi:hypothetical protein